jgi:hypothetical protein
MSQSKYKDIGKKQIINVVSQVIQKVEAIEMTLNLFIQYMDKDNKFNDYMTEQLGGKNEASENGEVDTDRDIAESTED